MTGCLVRLFSTSAERCWNFNTLYSRIETVKYWAGQRLLLSPLHVYYLKLAGQAPKPGEWLASEGPRPGTAKLPQDYSIVPPAGARLAPQAELWLNVAWFSCWGGHPGWQ